MSDTEYKIHMTMWAALKSPLIMGTDIRSLNAQAYTIYMNPAILAISQDPLGQTVNRRWRYFVGPEGPYGQGEIQMWSGQLSQGDWIVILLNAANQAMQLNATLSDVFADQGFNLAPQVKQDWDVYDLWANRMPNMTANQILSSNSTMGAMNVTSYLYNATAQSYADGIMKNDTLLMGQKVGMWNAGAKSVWSTMVGQHDVAAYRLRPRMNGMNKRDEL